MAPPVPPLSKRSKSLMTPHWHRCAMGRLAVIVECRQTNWSLMCRKTIAIQVSHFHRHSPTHPLLDITGSRVAQLLERHHSNREKRFPALCSDLNGGEGQRDRMLINKASHYYKIIGTALSMGGLLKFQRIIISSAPKNAAHHPPTKKHNWGLGVFSVAAENTTCVITNTFPPSTDLFLHASAKRPSLSGSLLSSANPQKYLQCHLSCWAGHWLSASLYQRPAKCKKSVAEIPMTPLT